MSGLRIVLQRLVRRFTIRTPCWICDKCGWRERHEAEVWCWKCGKRRGGQMIYTPNAALRGGEAGPSNGVVGVSE